MDNCIMHFKRMAHCHVGCSHGVQNERAVLIFDLSYDIIIYERQTEIDGGYYKCMKTALAREKNAKGMAIALLAERIIHNRNESVRLRVKRSGETSVTTDPMKSIYKYGFCCPIPQRRTMPVSKCPLK